MEKETTNRAFTAAVDAGLAYFRERAEKQTSLAASLLSAVESGEMERARRAYVESRYPYEEIETLAGSFSKTDANLDARPYAFKYGETSDEFRGFHRIERLLYRDDDLDAAVPYAERLLMDTKRLQDDLTNRDQFGPVKHFEGMIGLANEIPSKKISSEEETFSDQSLLIFHSNWKGIHSQIEPFVPEIRSRDEATAREVIDAYESAQTTVSPFFCDEHPGAAPYSSVGNEKRGEIVRAGYRFRNALVEAADVLELNTSWDPDRATDDPTTTTGM